MAFYDDALDTGQPEETMSAAAVEQHHPTLLEVADRMSDQLIGHRVEIIGGQITVTPPANRPHSRVLARMNDAMVAAGLQSDQTEVLQAVGVWLPEGPSDYAIPDLAVLDVGPGDDEDDYVAFGCYDPAIFRMVLEVTSSNLSDDLKKKPAAYAGAGIPVYVIVDRKNEKVMVLTDPSDGEYRVHAVHHRGQSFTLPESIGAAVTLSVDGVLGEKD
ncbi:Uma2 family endonuclease [Kitasatospora gansuensis]|uniref:Uma2 family endonuclease n=1 Tax=Kitasatospora gansuensis TaxID=258050 RepID=A0A7W7S7P3_9ACTN|nr:Uma2 family endonuclease [Kitasatospora gansuensis]MBB4945454.1 Uma2 family endonuclease [Kitasatospora gansuensis]